ncbi:MAG: hypothetical protein WDZ40_01480 [Candidatus Spechtbacterales bacterium]
MFFFKHSATSTPKDSLGDSSLLCSSYSDDFLIYYYSSYSTEVGSEKTPSGDPIINELYYLVDGHGEDVTFVQSEIKRIIFRSPTEEPFVAEEELARELFDFEKRFKPTFQKTIWPIVGEKGRYEYCVLNKDDKYSNIVFDWNGVENAEVKKIEENFDQTVFEIEGIDLSSFDAMFYINPFGYVEKFFPRGLKYLNLDKTSIEKGRHIFIVKQDGQWHKAVVHNPEDFEGR